MNKPQYEVGQLFYETLNGRVWQVTEVQEEIGTDHYRCWYYLNLVIGHSERVQATVLDETLKRSMVAINSEKSIQTVETLYG